MPLNAGQIINNRYRITKLLGQGGFGAVYRAWDLSLKKPCAVKQNFESSPQARKQFEREAVILARLHHPNLPRVTDHFTLAGQGQYLVMDYVEGEDLQELLDRQSAPLPENRILPWIEQICDALTYLHNQNPPIIHRDVKPANIKITPQGNAFLVDFGIAKVYDPRLKTTIGAQAVTPGYSPLEQYGHGSTDARSDIYALGATLYTLLTSQILPESTQRAALDTIIPPEQINPHISRPVATAIRKSVQVDTTRRYRSAAAFKVALTVHVTPTVYQPVLKPYTRLSPANSRPVNTSWLPWVGLGLAGIVIIFLVAMVFADREPKPTLEVAVVVETVMVTAANDGTFGDMREDASPTNTSTSLATQTLAPTISPTPTSSPVPTLTPSITLSPTPQLPPVLVEAYCNVFDESPIYVKQHQPVIIWWRWDAKTADQAQDHLDAAHYQILLDGEEIIAERQTGIEYLSDKGWYRVSWYAGARILSPGTHRTERYLSWDWKIYDGWDHYGPGSNIETEWDFCDVIVDGN